MTDTILIIGRVLFALLFISSGISHFTKSAAMTGYAQFKKVPMAKFSVLLSGAMILPEAIVTGKQIGRAHV